MSDLNGACKEAFEEWFRDSVEALFTVEVFSEQRINIVQFYELPDSMRFGVYQDFFDSVGLFGSVTYSREYSYGYEIESYEFGITPQKYTGFFNRSTPQKTLIVVENEIFNQRKGNEIK